MRRSLFIAIVSISAFAEIPRPTDAPKPLSPADEANSFHLPAGYTMKLLAAEPLIREPSGVCWDERGRMIVTELHGYNVEGQYDIDELNKSGELDLQVRRIQANDAAKERAKADNYGTVKALSDTDGDGVMDKADVWADHLPLCYGAVPARGGVIIACAPDILYLADKDGDGKAEEREVLFTGFGVGQPERGVNCPTWGPDNWIYFGRGHSGGTITGPHLKKPVVIGNTDFRIRADGSAIEAITGSTKTIGMTFTEGGDRFVTSTTSPGLFVTPIAPRYFERNPDAAAPLADAPAADYNTVFPLASPHPWRTKREQHAEYFAFYKKISLSDAAASGYFTSACSPLVYQDKLMPELQGQYFVCEPAQNLVHRAQIVREGTQLRLKRLPQEEKSEFLASTDPWFHPIGLQPTPDGGIAVIDFYREIIEDYSAIPRHLQQQYGVINGHDRGRIWLLTKTDHKPALNTPMAALDDAALVKELSSDLHWRRRTAQRLLVERMSTLVPDMDSLRNADERTWIFAVRTFATRDVIDPGWEHLTIAPRMLLGAALEHSSPCVRVEALRIADREFADKGLGIEESLLATQFPADTPPELALQAALSLGQSSSPDKPAALTRLARSHGTLRWVDAAIASSAFRIEKAVLVELAADRGKGEAVMVNLAGVIAARGDAKEISDTIAALESAKFTGKPLEILKLGLEEAKPLANKINVPTPAAPTAEQNAAWEKRVPAVLAALKDKPDIEEGRTLFQGICAACHRSHGIGVSVGPDLDAEFQRAPEVILRDVMFPSEAARPGFETVMAKTQRGETLIGIAASDSPTSITLRLPGGTERTVLRKRASISTLRNVSLMPAGLGDVLKPRQIANIIAFLRSPPARGR